jgi:hypothetical protein
MSAMIELTDNQVKLAVIGYCRRRGEEIRECINQPWYTPADVESFKREHAALDLILSGLSGGWQESQRAYVQERLPELEH